MVGARIGQILGHYFVVLTMRPDRGVGYVDTATQTEHEGHEDDSQQLLSTTCSKVHLYAEVISVKADASAAVQQL